MSETPIMGYATVIALPWQQVVFMGCDMGVGSIKTWWIREDNAGSSGMRWCVEVPETPGGEAQR